MSGYDDFWRRPEGAEHSLPGTRRPRGNVHGGGRERGANHRGGIRGAALSYGSVGNVNIAAGQRGNNSQPYRQSGRGSGNDRGRAYQQLSQAGGSRGNGVHRQVGPYRSTQPHRQVVFGSVNNLSRPPPVTLPNALSRHSVSVSGAGPSHQNNGNAAGVRIRNANFTRNTGLERKLPAFGFKRLYGFLSIPTEQVILAIDRDLTAWKEFLESDDLTTARSDNLLVLVMQVLAEKVCDDTILVTQQMGILTTANGPNFISKLSQKICSGGDFNIQSRNLSSDFHQLDTAPKIFFKNLHKYISFMAKRMPNITLDYLLPILMSVIGAVVSQSTPEPDLAEKFQALRQEIQSMIKKQEEKPKRNFNNRSSGFSEEEQQEMHAMEAPDDFREMTIVPTASELLSTNEVFLRPNKTSGAYVDANHYLDVQFRLLREDFVQPLKNGVQDFMKNKFDYIHKKKRIPLGTIRIYQGVQIKSGEFVRNKFMYKVQLEEDSYNKVRWEKSKRLLTGSLLVFTSDFFKTAYFATVFNRVPEELAKGIVSVAWEGEKPVWDRNVEYLMVECEVYFEAYRHTLQTLKELELQDFPMCKFIVNASADVGPPKYLERAVDTMKICLENNEDIFVSPLLQTGWPSHELLGLDINQFDAFQAALTKEFVIIQGPPGTGKTFLGLKIAEVFLNNQNICREIDTGPILAVCYTNHALDQFLEGILDVFTRIGELNPSIVRVGSRSKSEKLQDFTLDNVSRRESRNMPRSYYPSRKEAAYWIYEFQNQRSSAMAVVMELTDIQGIVNFEKLDVWKELSTEFPAHLLACLNEHWLGLSENLFQRRGFREDDILAGWFVLRTAAVAKPKKVTRSNHEITANGRVMQNGIDGNLEEDYDLTELEETRIYDDIYAELEFKAPANIDNEKHVYYISGLSIKECEKNLRKLVRLSDETNNNWDLSWTMYNQEMAKLESQKKITERRWRFLDKLFNLYKTNMIEFPNAKLLMERMKAADGLEAVAELHRLSRSQRWALFFEVIERARILSMEKVFKIDEQLIAQQKKLQEIETYGKGHLLLNSQVVGMTTTGAAKYQELVKMMKSRIVIVEEAAEVFESHIVTCISKHCEHLILIGDHRQLRPNPTVYELAKKFSLDISLFERMINNNLNCYQLKVQHRMRPEIANLVVGTIYEELHNHDSVNLYPSVKGVTKNLFFISHKELEKSESDSLSKSNQFEAKFLAALCRYLILQGYLASQITILTAYMGQMFLLKQTVSKFPNCYGVRVTCVDNFQGEENDIILLSLVRSNSESKVGFLSVDNRVCVALSRARHGLFIIGNMTMLASKCKTWSQIQEKLNLRMEIGPTLTLECQIHGTLSEINTDNDFTLRVPEGGCHLPCDTLLDCTHKCQSICHINDLEHKKYRCQFPCLKLCVNDHPCNTDCFRKCPLCFVSMNKQLPCQHEKIMPCHQNTEEIECMVEVVKNLPCQHEKTMPCHQSIEVIECMSEVVKNLPCGHEHEMACHRDPNNYKCRITLDKELRCGHIRNLECNKDPDLETCRVNMTKTLIPCGHEQQTECRFEPDQIKCDTMVTRRFEECGHELQVPCRDVNKPKVYCLDKCTIRLPCGHACTKLCHISEDPQHLSYVCKKNCTRSCTSGHKCKSKHKCHANCLPCKVEVDKNLNCGHTSKMRCYVDPGGFKCLKSCKQIHRNCGHKCRGLCFEPCVPCQIKVRKVVPECRHVVSLACSSIPTRDLCKELVKPSNQSECLHDTLVPCRISSTATHKEAMHYCRHPCQTLFTEVEGGCDHQCKGNCNSCRQGRFHKKCQEECGKTLVCGHVCEFPCSKSCPPCDKKCVMKCEHSKCGNKCGTPCQDCSETCSWQCPHKTCSKLCREICDRDPCDQPCKEKLNCGHDCIGFCGEPCPPQCRICDINELTEFSLYGNEGDDDSRFVFLPDCKHSIEVEGLTYHMNNDDDGQIGIKRCPRCHTVIQSCRRFGNVIRNRLKDVISVKDKIFGNQKIIQETQITLIPKLQRDKDLRWLRIFPALHKYLLDILTYPVNTKKGRTEFALAPKPLDEHTITSVNIIATYADGVIDSLLQSKSEHSLELNDDFMARYQELFKRVMQRTLPLSPVEIRDIGRELDRLHDLNQVYVRRSSPQFVGSMTRAAPVYEVIMAVVLSHKPYTDKYKRKLHILLKELEEILKTGLGITESERREIVTALGMRQGHWFKCPNGHVYVITECGGAEQEGTCNECGAAIGGRSHQLLQDNSLATEMDGAVNTAYPGTLLRY